MITGDHECGYLWGPGSDPEWQPLVNNGQGNVPGMEYYKTSHTNSLIPVFAKGAGAELLGRHVAGEDPRRGAYIDNIAIGKVMLEVLSNETSAKVIELQKDDGYRGIWYANQKTDDEYAYKYSGGLGTYCAKHIPHAIYAPQVNKTFFVYGGTSKDKDNLLEMVSYYDHATGLVPRPTILVDKQTSDAHDNPVISIDDGGHIWVFASSHGKGRPSYIFRSLEPYSVEGFEQVAETNFSYPQPWFIKDQGFLFMLTSYDGGRVMYCQNSADGRTWGERKQLAFIDEGHYQTSRAHGSRVGTAFNYHPKAFGGDTAKKGLNWRTNLYYMESADMGGTWTTVDGRVVETPVTTARNPALIHDYEAEGRLVYLKDVNYDAKGNPVILHVTASTWLPGEAGEPREWRVAHWNGAEWLFHTITSSDNNYDMGSLYIDDDGTWRIIAPTTDGPQQGNPGGEMALWISTDLGVTWTLEREVTAHSEYNHTYARRPVDAHPDFYAFWADGHGRQPSESHLYFCDKTGQKVFRLPYLMDGDTATPEPVAAASEGA
ncbi:MAG: BNR-4 repeat-containing protein [Candidatus Hydrogenedentes bacterium]|nr:BNR-4 repeat-containing protein [Candidatus Hydrogenedentota bacterium]